MEHMPTLHIHEYGPSDGSPLLALHGVTGHGARWQKFAEQYLTDYRVIAPDLRGHGQSLAVPPWTLEQHAADLLELIDSYRLDSVAVMGHSFGGAIALHLSRLAPQRIQKLLLLDPAIGLDPAGCLEEASMESKQTFPTREEAVAQQQRNWANIAAEAVEAEVDANWHETEAGWTQRFTLPAVITAWGEMARPAVLPHPGTPTLLVPALQEDLVRPELVQGLKIALEDDLQVVSLDCGHMLYLEKPDELAELVTTFLTK
jgi:lipase